VGQKRGHELVTVIPSNLNRFTIFSLKDSLVVAVAVKGTLKIPSHLAYVSTLPYKTLMSAKQAIKPNDKLQGSVAAYLRCGWVWWGVVRLIITKLRKVYC